MAATAHARPKNPGAGHIRAALALVIVCTVCLFAASSVAAPRADLWERWTAHNPASVDTLDHSVWDRLTKRHVTYRSDGVAAVAYGQFSLADARALGGYLSAMSNVAVSTLNRAEQMAYWINLYNALTVRVILDHYPVKSIRDIDISPGFFSNGPWGAELLRVEGEEISLDDIEHRILRPIWRDPRIHYAVNCASIGCPDLRRGAFTAATLEGDLDQAARSYINHPRGAEVRGGRLVVSSIYDWFEDDFGGDDAGVIAHLKKHAAPDLKARLAGVTSVYDDRYDWRLNDPATPDVASDIVRRNQLLGNSRGGGGRGAGGS